jgi:hypothetical protein
MRYALFWDITQLVVGIPYRRFGTTFRSHFQDQEIQEDILTREDVTDEFPHYTPHNIPEKRRSSDAVCLL